MTTNNYSEIAALRQIIAAHLAGSWDRTAQVYDLQGRQLMQSEIYYLMAQANDARFWLPQSIDSEKYKKMLAICERLIYQFTMKLHAPLSDVVKEYTALHDRLDDGLRHDLTSDDEPTRWDSWASDASHHGLWTRYRYQIGFEHHSDDVDSYLRDLIGIAEKLIAERDQGGGTSDDRQPPPESPDDEATTVRSRSSPRP